MLWPLLYLLITAVRVTAAFVTRFSSDEFKRRAPYHQATGALAVVAVELLARGLVAFILYKGGFFAPLFR